MKALRCVVGVMSIMLGFGVALALEGSTEHQNQRLLDSCRFVAARLDAKEIDYLKAEESQPCIYYMKGFFASAQAVDRINADELSQANSKPRTFIDRAYRTRLGEAPKKIPASQFLHYCVPGDPEKVVMENISSYLSVAAITDMDALKENILKVLTKSYPCQQSNELK